jgi:hypothetical protein
LPQVGTDDVSNMSKAALVKPEIATLFTPFTKTTKEKHHNLSAAQHAGARLADQYWHQCTCAWSQYRVDYTIGFSLKGDTATDVLEPKPSDVLNNGGSHTFLNRRDSVEISFAPKHKGRLMRTWFTELRCLCFE